MKGCDIVLRDYQRNMMLPYYGKNQKKLKKSRETDTALVVKNVNETATMDYINKHYPDQIINTVMDHLKTTCFS